MAEPALSAQDREPARDHGFHTAARPTRRRRDRRCLLAGARRARGTSRRRSPTRPDSSARLRVWIDGEPHLRCYSMSSSPATDDDFTVTVKRVPDGHRLQLDQRLRGAGTEIETTLPAGVFCLTERAGDVVAFAAGSGITPIISLLKSAVATTSRRVRVLYANRDLESTIFRAEIDSLVARHPDRIEVRHHLDVEAGYIDREAVAGLRRNDLRRRRRVHLRPRSVHGRRGGHADRRRGRRRPRSTSSASRRPGNCPSPRSRPTPPGRTPAPRR